MDKMQVLFPGKQLNSLREAAEREDRTVSDIIRQAADEWLQRHGDGFVVAERAAPLRFDLGKVRIPASQLREAAYGNEEL